MIRGELTPRQGVALVALRTLVGWHFLYEGLVKLWLPGWRRDGVPLPLWSAAGYLKAASGPLAELCHSLARSSWLPILGWAISLGLLLVGLSLMLGLFTQAGGFGALALLALFYLSNVPTQGAPVAGAEGVYLFVDKNLVEAAAVVALLAFRTGRIAGLDLLLWNRRGATNAGGSLS